MQFKILLKLSLFSIVGIISFSILIFFLILDLPAQAFYVKPVKNTVFKEQTSLFAGQAGSGLPIRLKIPKINVYAAIEYVSLTPKGLVGVPKGPVNAGWFNLGPRPGEKGNSVIVGHFGWKNGIPAVFDNLHKLQKGDKLYVLDKKGTTTTFVVRELRIYGENEDASSVFNSSDGKSHLNLITCEGLWNKTKKSYSNRLVVFTDKEYE